MADKIITWYVDGSISKPKVELAGTRYLDNHYAPEWVSITCRESGLGTPTIIDINDDGESIFETQPAITEYQTAKVWTTIPGNTIRKGSILTMDVDQVFNSTWCRDLTVELGLREV